MSHSWPCLCSRRRCPKMEEQRMRLWPRRQARPSRMRTSLGLKSIWYVSLACSLHASSSDVVHYSTCMCMSEDQGLLHTPPRKRPASTPSPPNLKKRTKGVEEKVVCAGRPVATPQQKVTKRLRSKTSLGSTDQAGQGQPGIGRP